MRYRYSINQYEESGRIHWVVILEPQLHNTTFLAIDQKLVLSARGSTIPVECFYKSALEAALSLSVHLGRIAK